MKKGFVLAVLIVVFVSIIGCAGGKSPSEELPPKLPPRQVNIQKEFNITTNLPKGSILVPTNDYKMILDIIAVKQKNPAEQIDHLFQAWEPQPTKLKNKLTKLWSLELNKDIGNEDDREKHFNESIPWIKAKYETLSEGWFIHFFNVQGVYDCSNGRKLEGVHGGIGYSDVHSDWMFGGPFDLESLEQYDLSYPIACWDKKLGTIRWMLSSISDDGKRDYFVHNGAVYFNGPYDLTKVDAWTGIVEWQINFKVPETSDFDTDLMAPIYWQVSDNYFWLLNFTTDFQKDIAVYRLNPETLEIMKVKLDLVGGVVANGDKVCIIYDSFKKTMIIGENGVPQGGSLVPEVIQKQVDEKTLAFLLAMPYRNKFVFGYEPDFKTNKEPNNNSIFYVPESTYKPYLFDPFTKEDPVLVPKDLKMTDHKQKFPFLLWKDFYIEDDKNFYGFDIESGQKTWSIPKSELGPNPAIAISDWRGVLVVDDKQITAWGVK